MSQSPPYKKIRASNNQSINQPKQSVIQSVGHTDNDCVDLTEDDEPTSNLPVSPGISQSINPSINQSINQSGNQSVNQTVNQSIARQPRPVDRYEKLMANATKHIPSVSQATKVERPNQSVSQSSNPTPVSEPINQSTNPVVNQSISRSTGQRATMKAKTSQASPQSSSESSSNPSNQSINQSASQSITVLSYNIWFDDVLVAERMTAIGQMIENLDPQPDVLLFQEVTSSLSELLVPVLRNVGYGLVCPLGEGRVYGETIFQRQVNQSINRSPVRWQAVGQVESIEFPSFMGRYLQILEFQSVSQSINQSINQSTNQSINQRVMIATAHLESTAQFSKIRMGQLGSTFEMLQEKNLPFIFGADTNLGAADSKKLVLPSTVCDAWIKCGQDKRTEWTWDTSINKNLGTTFAAKCRFDRFYCEQSRVQPVKFELIGQKRMTGSKLYPSDHWGIVATFEIKS